MSKTPVKERIKVNVNKTPEKEDIKVNVNKTHVR